MFDYLLLFFGVILGNIFLGIYNRLNKGENFNFSKTLKGFIKGILTALSCFLTAIVYEKLNVVIEINGIMLSPNEIIISGILLYLYKNIENLREIVKINNNNLYIS